MTKLSKYADRLEGNRQENRQEIGKYHSKQHGGSSSESDDDDTVCVWNPNCQHEQQLHSESHEFNTNFVQSWHIEEIAFATTDIGLISLAT